MSTYFNCFIATDSRDWNLGMLDKQRPCLFGLILHATMLFTRSTTYHCLTEKDTFHRKYI